MRVGLGVCAALLLTADRAAAGLIVTGIPTPESAGSVSSVTVTAQTSKGATATAYTGTVRFNASDAQATLPANYTFTSCATGCDNGVRSCSRRQVHKPWLRPTRRPTRTPGLKRES